MPCTDDASGDTGDRRSSFGCAASAAVQPSLSVKTARSWRAIVPSTHLAREGRMTVTIGRRELLVALGGAAAAWPLAARPPQGGRIRGVGVLMNLAAEDAEGQARLAAFLQGLQEAGWAVGRNVRVDIRWGASDVDRIRKHAADLVALAPNVILASTGQVHGGDATGDPHRADCV